ncbi:SDR family NAD(P)-dependent oxidoreductase [Chitinophaga rhizosphaerae]|uniref:SDR family NAD(P)-dependent oxidoreductase n=1 Tax=Chitinophaga rhizosphaerae TaxID=1864947 RepID=UPI000F7FC859|nr:SDR family oxidoreductase [Chitinophaga rhizosphaerae]
MLLAGKTAVVYGAGGSLGGAVAAAFAKEGAFVHLTGRNLDSVERTADVIRKSGSRCSTAVVDALDAGAVARHLEETGRVDISFNAVGWEDRQDQPLAEMDPEDFLRPVLRAMETEFLTCTAAARAMMRQRSGVILTLTATPGGIGYPHVGGFGPACCAVESLTRNLASELGPYGVRVVNIRSGGSPDTRVFREALEQGGAEVAGFLDKLEADTMLKKMPLMEDIAQAAVFLASDHASKITGVTLDVTCGTTAALNYATPKIPFLQHA